MGPEVDTGHGIRRASDRGMNIALWGSDKPAHCGEQVYCTVWSSERTGREV